MSDLSIELSEALIGQPSYGDLVLDGGDAVMTTDINPSGTDVTQQFLTTRLRLFLGEAFMALDDGVPWYQQIFVKNADQSTIDSLLKDCILGTPGVQALLNYSSTQDRANRAMTVRFTVQTSTGKRISTAVPVSA